MAVLKIKQIKPSPTNPRKLFDPAKLAELADSIRAHGLIQPITVREISPGKWECVCGERRLKAMALAGIDSAECNVVKLNDVEVMEVQAIENDQRADVLPSERAAGYRQLIKAGRSVSEVAAKVGRSESWVSAVVRLNDLPPEAAEALDAGEIPPSVGDLVARVPGVDSRRKVALLVLAGKISPGAYGVAGASPLNVRQTKTLISDHFCRQLKGGPFDSKDPTLPPGSCKDCKKRAGNAGPEYKDTRADVCLDVECFSEKTRITMERGKAEAEGSGLTVLDAKTLKLVFPYGEQFSETSGFYSLDNPLPWDLRQRAEAAALPAGSMRKLLEELGDDVVNASAKYVAYSPSGYRHNLIKKTDAKQLLDKILPQKQKTATASSAEPSVWQVEREARKVYAEAAGESFRLDGLISPAHAAAAMGKAARIMAGLICRELALRNPTEDDLPVLLSNLIPAQAFAGTPPRYKTERPWELTADAKSLPALLAGIVSGVAFILADSGEEGTVPEFQALIGKDLEQIEKETRKRLAEEMRTKAKADKKTKKGWGK